MPHTHTSRWATAVADYLARADPPEVFRVVLEELARVGPEGITQALDPEQADAAKGHAVYFFLHAIELALDDHVLTDEEVADLRRLRLILRIQEGDLVEHRPKAVARVLGRELEAILEDEAISPDETLMKARLQELLGLGYDQFIEVVAPAVDELRQRLMAVVESGRGANWFTGEAQAVRQRLAALDLVNFLHFTRQRVDPRAGYIYLLINPAIPGMVKVGRTSRPPAQRAAELGGATGVPTPFVVAFDVAVADAHSAEAYVHARLEEAGHRVADNREFFSCSPSEAVRVMIEAAGEVR